MDEARQNREHGRQEQRGQDQRLLDRRVRDRVDADVRGGLQERHHHGVDLEVDEAERHDQAHRCGDADEPPELDRVEADVRVPEPAGEHEGDHDARPPGDRRRRDESDEALVEDDDQNHQEQCDPPDDEIGRDGEPQAKVNLEEGRREQGDDPEQGAGNREDESLADTLGERQERDREEREHHDHGYRGKPKEEKVPGRLVAVGRVLRELAGKERGQAEIAGREHERCPGEHDREVAVGIDAEVVRRDPDRDECESENSDLADDLEPGGEGDALGQAERRRRGDLALILRHGAPVGGGVDSTRPAYRVVQRSTARR